MQKFNGENPNLGYAAEGTNHDRIVSVGVTTYNNISNAQLLDSLHSLASAGVSVFVFDDCSTDGTIELVRQHPISALDNFRFDVARTNSGGPLAGRRTMAANCVTEYITFIDGDDELHPAAFLNFIDRIPSGMDMVMTPYKLYGRNYCPVDYEGMFAVDNATITLTASGIGGRVYNARRFLECAPGYYVPRAEDAHVNLAIIGNSIETPKLFALQGDPFYIIHAGTKSKSTDRISNDELQKRRELYDIVRKRFNLGNEYLIRSKAFLLSVINNDAIIIPEKRRLLTAQVQDALTPRLARIVLACNDPSVLGGVASRVNLSMEEAIGRDIEYNVVSFRNENRIADNRYLSCDNVDHALETIAKWDRASTAVVVQAAILRVFPVAVRKALEQFPIVYYGDAQMAALLQTKAYYNERSFFESFRASSALSLSYADISFQRQLGVYGQQHTVLPTVQRRRNSYKRRKKPVIGYVGVADFKFKATDRMIDIAISAKRQGLPPIHIFTSDAINSPDFKRLTERIRESAAKDHVVIHLNESNKNNIFGSISVLYVPSKNEAGGTVVLEALSHGVPVAGHSYAPAVNEAISDGVDGFIFDDYDPENIVARIAQTSSNDFRLMSSAAFRKHHQYTPLRHLGDIENASRQAITKFATKNELQVFPILEWAGPAAATVPPIASPKPIVTPKKEPPAPQSPTKTEILQPKLLAMEKRIAALERSFPLRLTRKMEWLKKYIRAPI